MPVENHFPFKQRMMQLGGDVFDLAWKTGVSDSLNTIVGMTDPSKQIFAGTVWGAVNRFARSVQHDEGAAGEMEEPIATRNVESVLLGINSLVVPLILSLQNLPSEIIAGVSLLVIEAGCLYLSREQNTHAAN